MSLQKKTTVIGEKISSGTKLRNSGFFFQPKLAVNQPGDSYEQEADKMADRVMHMPAGNNMSPGFFSPAITTVNRKCQHCEEDEKLHRKESSNSGVQGSSELDNYVGSLGSSGQPLPESSRMFFEPRFGHDFSDVRVHTDSVAAKSAQSINALAYTTGNNIVFNSGQFSPESDSGKRLMAHELTHVVQQNQGIAPKYIQRKINNPPPVYSLKNAVDAVIASGDLALTTPTIDGREFPHTLDGNKNLQHAGEIILESLTKGLTINPTTNICTCEERDINASANILKIDAPVDNKWSGNINGSTLEAQNKKCKGKGSIPVEITGNPDANTIEKRIVANEMDHYNDWVSISKPYLDGFVTSLKSFKDSSAKSDDDCQKSLLKFIIDKHIPDKVIKLLKEVSDKRAGRDVRNGAHDFHQAVKIDANCNRVDGKIS